MAQHTRNSQTSYMCIWHSLCMAHSSSLFSVLLSSASSRCTNSLCSECVPALCPAGFRRFRSLRCFSLVLPSTSSSVLKLVYKAHESQFVNFPECLSQFLIVGSLIIGSLKIAVDIFIPWTLANQAGLYSPESQLPITSLFRTCLYYCSCLFSLVLH